jgi:hypothetical protein
MSSPALWPHPDALFTEFEDGTGVLLHLQTKFYFALNTSGVLLWKRLVAGVGSEDSLAQVLCAKYEVEEATARADVVALLSELSAEGLVANAPGR